MVVAIQVERLVVVALFPFFFGSESRVVLFVSVEGNLKLVVVLFSVFEALVSVQISHGRSE